MNAAEQKGALYATINECDAMILQAGIDNDAERADHRNDARRLVRHCARCAILVKHREQLEKLYVSLYNENPWANVPY